MFATGESECYDIRMIVRGCAHDVSFLSLHWGSGIMSRARNWNSIVVHAKVESSVVAVDMVALEFRKQGRPLWHAWNEKMDTNGSGNLWKKGSICPWLRFVRSWAYSSFVISCPIVESFWMHSLNAKRDACTEEEESTRTRSVTRKRKTVIVALQRWDFLELLSTIRRSVDQRHKDVVQYCLCWEQQQLGNHGKNPVLDNL